MSGHTPGPWTVTRHVLNFGRVVAPLSHTDRPFGGAVGIDVHRSKYMAAVAHVTTEKGRHFSAEEAEANASLIAAAPDLLAALRYMNVRFQKSLAGAPCFPDIEDERALDAAAVAIHKAEGVQP
jgi:hypothetical protein